MQLAQRTPPKQEAPVSSTQAGVERVCHRYRVLLGKIRLGRRVRLRLRLLPSYSERPTKERSRTEAKSLSPPMHPLPPLLSLQFPHLLRKCGDPQPKKILGAAGTIWDTHY